jgi:hypothetical protein
VESKKYSAENSVTVYLPSMDTQTPSQSVEPEEIQEMARRYAPAVLMRILQVAQFGKSEQSVIRACEIILDRGFGRPSIQKAITKRFNEVDLLPTSEKVLALKEQLAIEEERLAEEILNDEDFGSDDKEY